MSHLVSRQDNLDQEGFLEVYGIDMIEAWTLDCEERIPGPSRDHGSVTFLINGQVLDEWDGAERSFHHTVKLGTSGQARSLGQRLIDAADRIDAYFALPEGQRPAARFPVEALVARVERSGA